MIDLHNNFPGFDSRMSTKIIASPNSGPHRGDSILYRMLPLAICYTASVTGYYSDTDPKMEELQIRLLREATSWRKMELLSELNAGLISLAMIGLRKRFPDASDSALRRRLADLMLGEELARRVYGAVDEK